MFSWLTGKIALYALIGCLVIMAGMGLRIWWLKGDLEDARKELGEFKAAYTLLATKVSEQNTAINALGDRAKEADKRYEEAKKKRAKLKAELEAALHNVADHKPDPDKSSCENAMDLIEKAKR